MSINQENEMNDLIEKLRQQAELETGEAATTRRPSWAPALVLADELLEICRALVWLGPEDKPAARLWAVFADPKRLGTWQRNNLSNVPLHGNRVRVFDMIVGEKRGGPKRIYRTLKNENGQWDEGPRWTEPEKPYQLDGCNRVLARYRNELAEPLPTAEELRSHPAFAGVDEGWIERHLQWNARDREWKASQVPKLEARIAEETAAYERAVQRYHWHVRAFELGRQRLDHMSA
jgi:hypothetical protein